MTTLAIIGSGILGRTLLYTLAKEQKTFEKITLFHSDSFVFPCTLNSTAIVASRGVTKGHSSLGDFIVDGFEAFKQHTELDKPRGVEAVTHYTSASDELDSFKKRYPDASMERHFLQDEFLTAQEKAFMIEPDIYTEWLISEARVMLKGKLEIIPEFVTEVRKDEGIHVLTQEGRQLAFDKVVLAGGNYNRFWKQLAPKSVLETSRPVQGSYFEFSEIEWNLPSFSLTHDGHNIVWNNSRRKLLLGSTSLDVNHTLSPLQELSFIHEKLSKVFMLELPGIHLGTVKVGLREKAKKREAYLFSDGNCIFAGGLYKNGFILSKKISENLVHQFL